VLSISPKLHPRAHRGAKRNARCRRRSTSSQQYLLQESTTPQSGRPGGVVKPLSENPPQDTPGGHKRPQDHLAADRFFQIWPMRLFMPALRPPYWGYAGVGGTASGDSRKCSVTSCYSSLGTAVDRSSRRAVTKVLPIGSCHFLTMCFAPS